ncbi:Electron-transferring-flavoprotein dehydrogenase [Solidesulfovibrio carbinoliphilus subsp. oakridgensis]|uniref:Electron transfer flavoprotein-ubiquinone oxidoreductase n=1 Tax=Solidesulfovibrio carbinoliphilus subsp. oakridgensis TaxID=694327 RepID=G7QB01_9BACT|nr:4Fe-4S ferredoxin [Solidesulfovibrio carbinoliphilus]EHJ48342.1 Electron-transferring-flavoprotein dehydrogenase [Solidesulfovibrio carbinoliphilus subsp. oakridgensis]
MDERQVMEADIVCVGFGPAMGGFLTTLARGIVNEDGSPVMESALMPGLPPQVICYERADDLGVGVSGVVSKARGIRTSFPHLKPSDVPMCAPITDEKVVYLLDPVGASRRPWLMKAKDAVLKLVGERLPGFRDMAVELPCIPPFLQKHGGLTFSIGQFNQWVGSGIMATGAAQIWPSSPVAGPVVEDRKVVGIRLADQGVDKTGKPEMAFLPGMEVRAALTVVGDGPVGPVGRALDEMRGLPEGHHQRDYAVGMKMVIDLPGHCPWKEGTVIHTIGYPEPEIFGFLYVLPGRVASMGIFVPSWFDNPVRTAYRYLQHWMQHPYIWKNIKGGTLRSWGAKTLQESGKNGEPYLVGDGYARIGEGSGTTNVLTGSGVDEAWMSGVLLGEAVVQLLEQGLPFTAENLEETYVARRRASWLEEEARAARRSREGFAAGFLPGLIGMGLSGLTGGRLCWPAASKPVSKRIPTIEDYYRCRISCDEIERIRKDATAKGLALHDALMDRAGWPAIEYDGQLLISHQDALLLGGKVQAGPGYADHVTFEDPDTCRACREKTCIEACSGQAITTNPDDGVPLFDREKCVHCGACLWNCSKPSKADPERTNVRFAAGAGGLHSAEN